MIYIDPNTSSNVTVTLREKANGLNPYYTWVLIDKESKLTYTYSADNFSNSPYFDSFTFTNGVGSPTAGYIPLSGGEYEYEVYEKTLQYDLNISVNDNLVERGILIIGNTYSNIQQYTQSTYQEVYVYRKF